MAISQLSEHFQVGRLTAEEFEERSGLALQAKTGKDLAVLLADLPRNRAAAPSPLPLSPLPPGRLPATRRGILAPVVAALFIGLAAVAIHASGQPSWHHGLVSSGPNFASLVPILVVVAVVAGLARRRRRGDRWDR
ncbi:MAG: DUF1707 SHOCT-like domain-containing protein [Streptosporangiaceae bacterium]